MINVCAFIISIICWLIIYFTRPYCKVRSKFWTIFWIGIFGIVGFCVGFFFAQAIIYLLGGTTII